MLFNFVHVFGEPQDISTVLTSRARFPTSVKHHATPRLHLVVFIEQRYNFRLLHFESAKYRRFSTELHAVPHAVQALNIFIYLLCFPKSVRRTHQGRNPPPPPPPPLLSGQMTLIILSISMYLIADLILNALTFGYKFNPYTLPWQYPSIYT
jgi:hypothetical protein